MADDACLGLHVDFRIDLCLLGRKRNFAYFIIDPDFEDARLLGDGLNNFVNPLPFVPEHGEIGAAHDDIAYLRGILVNAGHKMFSVHAKSKDAGYAENDNHPQNKMDRQLCAETYLESTHIFLKVFR